jgi:indolepyruvate ferredoxin oxidoreductase
MALAAVTLDDKYTVESGRVLLTGTQALIRLPLMQRTRDVAQGLDTAGFVSGYRGSPLGNVDREMWRAEALLKENHIHFQPGINEDLAATAVWGSQQVHMFGDAKYDGVFAMWYGKGPGVDRSGDAFRHGNVAGSGPNGGVLLLAGDDPAAKSSTVPSQSEYAFMDAQIPVLNPGNVQDILDFGLFGWALSRYSGCWTAMKTITEVMDSSASVSVDPERIALADPNDFEMPAGGLHARWPDPPLEQERRLQQEKLYAALAYARANRVDKTMMDSPRRRFGIITAGKSYYDVMQALEDLGIDEAAAAAIGLSIYKVGMVWPLERDGIRSFAEGLEEILVVEEKRGILENQVKEQLYNWRADVRPRIVGKFDEDGDWILPSTGELSPARIARAIAKRLQAFDAPPHINERLEFLDAKEKALDGPLPAIQRVPYFCSGCPHNTSTRVPEGSRATAGIGCHYMAVWMDRDTATSTHMGAEGTTWIGQAPFCEADHIFANLGDGTYYHSGLLAIRASVAAGVNITYKILFNDAVAMTGGQPHDGPISVPAITRQVAAEGVSTVVVVTDEPDKYPIGVDFASGVTVHHRDKLDSIQRNLRRQDGVTVIVYDQTCAAEKRRRRKRGLFPDPPKRPFINEAVCEGCGDCGVQSNCVSIAPVETEFGRKRAIDQSSCNKDFSCINGFCPSFVTVHGGSLRKQASGGGAKDMPFPVLPDPEVAGVDEPYGIVVTGIGGTGVVTVGALLAMAAHLEGKGVTVLDQIGLAQKNGAVVSHVRVARTPEAIHAVRIGAGGAHLLLGCDMVTAGGVEVLAKLRQGQSHAVINSHETMTADFTRDPDMVFPEQGLIDAIRGATSVDDAHFINAGRLATALLGDSIAANLFMVGYAYQKGLLPLGEDAILRAVELNGVAIDFNKQAFVWGRRAAVDADTVQRVAFPESANKSKAAATDTLDDVIARRVEALTAYQDAAYAGRYADLVQRARTAEAEKAKGMTGLAEAVARSYHKLLAYKDEYEVARLYTDPAFMASLRQRFDGKVKLSFHLAPPLLAQRNPDTGHLIKREFGPWMMSAFRLLAGLKGLRGTAFDIFGRAEERRTERRLITEYEALVDELLAGLTRDNHVAASALAALPETVRGFGHVKERNLATAESQKAELLEVFQDPHKSRSAAE